MKWNRVVLGAIAGLMLTTTKVEATPAVEIVTDYIAIAQSTEIVLIPGRHSLIEFRNGETIQFVSLADVHQIVFSTNLPIESGQASVIVLRTITPLRLKGVVETPARGIIREDFPNETVYPTNLVVVTSTPTGEKRTYIFDLKISLSQTSDISNGVAIIQEESTPTQQLLTLADGRQANWRDIERGYVVALREGYTNFTDPVVGKIQSFLALARQNVPFLEAAQRVELPFKVIETLAIIGLQAVPTQQYPERIIPQPPSTNPQTETAQDKLNFPISTPTPVQIPNLNRFPF